MTELNNVLFNYLKEISTNGIRINYAGNQVSEREQSI